jgi:hypothetical protein
MNIEGWQARLFFQAHIVTIIAQYSTLPRIFLGCGHDAIQNLRVYNLIGDGHHDLYPPIHVSLHPIRR